MSLNIPPQPMMEVEVTKTKEDDLKSGSVVRCLLYDARVRTTHDKNAEVPNMGLSHMACAQTGSADITDTKFGPCQIAISCYQVAIT